jgi:hypothetical protein
VEKSLNPTLNEAFMPILMECNGSGSHIIAWHVHIMDLRHAEQKFQTRNFRSAQGVSTWPHKALRKLDIRWEDVKLDMQ